MVQGLGSHSVEVEGHHIHILAGAEVEDCYNHKVLLAAEECCNFDLHRTAVAEDSQSHKTAAVGSPGYTAGRIVQVV